MLFKDVLTESTMINEVYFGKTPEILKAETQLDVLRNKYMKKYVFNPRINSDPDLLKFDRIMEDCFGFGCFTLHIHNEPTANAFTMPIDFRYDYVNDDKNLIVNTSSFKFNKDADYACILGVYSGLIFNPDFTTPEVMAIILHEIGHNFNSILNKPNGVLLSVYNVTICIIYMLSGSPMLLAHIAKNSNSYRTFMDKTGKQLRQNNNIMVVLYDYIIQLLNILKSGVKNLSDLFNILTMGNVTGPLVVYNGLITMLKDPAKIFKKKMQYNSEESADNFVTIYGYSSELITALRKIESAEGESSSFVMKNFNKIPVISQLFHFSELPYVILFGFFDEHPNSVNRAKDQVNMLNAELQKQDLDPKMKKYIQSDVNACNEALDTLVETKKQDPYIGRKLYNKIVNDYNINFKKTLFGNKHKFDEYDKTFKNGLKEE